MATIALMTDFGIKDGNVGVMKGVIWSICPEAQIADISHMIGAQDVREAALILARTVPYFPAGSIHLVVVDPGVGTSRRPMAARLGESYFVGPDNGVITAWLKRTRADGITADFVMLDRPEFRLPQVSHVFHGRDIFAPAAAHLARGVALHDLGSPLDSPVEIELPEPRRSPSGWDGEVIHIDHFGNVASNIRIEHLGEALSHKEAIQVRVGMHQIRGMVDTFGERTPGELVALMGSTGNLIVSVVNGNAARTLGIHVGDPLSASLPQADEIRDQGI